MSSPSGPSVGGQSTVHCVRCGADLQGADPDGACPQCGAAVRLAMLAQTPASDPPRMLCIRCGYDLRGIAHDRTCPECGTPVSRSAYGDDLAHADPPWLNRLHRGMLCLLLAVALIFALVALVFGLGFLAAPPRAPGLVARAVAQAVTALLSLSATGLGLAGVVLVTSPEPRLVEGEHAVSLRRFVRFGTLAAFAAYPLQQAARHANPHAALPLGILVFALHLTGIIAFCALLAHLRRLALRIPDTGLAGQTRIVMWGLIVCQGVMVLIGVLTVLTGSPGGFMCFCGLFLAFLVFGLWFIILLMRYHRAFGRAAFQAARFASTGP